MSKVFAYFSFILVFLFIFLPTHFVPLANASHKVFSDNFNDNNFDGWIIANNLNGRSCNAAWQVKDGMLGIKIQNESSCSTNIMPNDILWNNIGSNYILEFDMKFINGTDHNIAFRFNSDSINENSYYELHFQSPGDVILDGLGAGNYSTFISGNYPNDHTYKIKIVINEKNIKVYIDNKLVRDYTSTVDKIPTGRIALRAGVGADPNSETWFDNIVVTSIDSTLDVPHLMQTDPRWASNLYDHSDTWTSYTNSTIASSGCAMTSAAMILNYYNINKLPDGTKLDPGSLNDWLKNNNGYLRNGAIIWTAISDLSKDAQIKVQNPDFSYNALEFGWPESATSGAVLADLENERPVIMHVNDGKHFVVAKGFEEDTFVINDPLYDETKKLTDNYNGEFQSIRRYIPSHTDLSYIVLAVDPTVEITVKDSTGKEVGYQQIEQPVHTSNGVSNFANIPLKTVYFPKPETDTYSISISSPTAEDYTLDIYSYDKEGMMKKGRVDGFVSSTADENITLSFDEHDSSSNVFTKNVTIDSLIVDIGEATQLDLIHQGISRALLAVMNSTKRDIEKEREYIAGQKLGVINTLLTVQRGKHVKERAFDILIEDLTLLRSTF